MTSPQLNKPLAVLVPWIVSARMSLKTASDAVKRRMALGNLKTEKGAAVDMINSSEEIAKVAPAIAGIILRQERSK